MPISANDTNRKSWLEVLENSDFPIQNIPFGVFLTKENVVVRGSVRVRARWGVHRDQGRPTFTVSFQYSST